MSEGSAQAGIPIGDAAKRLGVTIELLRKRAQRGTIPAYKVDGRWFVVLDGAEPIVQDERAGQDVQDTPSRPGQDRPLRAVSPAALEQLEAVRDQWLQPLIDQIRELERDRGRLAESDRRERERAATAERLVEELRAEVQLLREIERVQESQDDTEPFTPVSSSDALGREQPAQGVETPEHQGSWLSVAWRRLSGRS